MLRAVLETSVIVLIFKCTWRWYACLKQKLICTYQDSQIYKLKKILRKKISQINEVNPDFLDNCRTIRYLFDFCKKWLQRTVQYSETSSMINLAKDAQKELYFSPVRIASSIIVIAILTNGVLSVILQKQIDLRGFLFRILFLFISTVGLSCEAGWPAIKKSSIFLRKAVRD